MLRIFVVGSSNGGKWTLAGARYPMDDEQQIGSFPTDGISRIVGFFVRPVEQQARGI